MSQLFFFYPQLISTFFNIFLYINFTISMSNINHKTWYGKYEKKKSKSQVVKNFAGQYM